MENESLAKIKLNKHVFCKSDLEGSFQVFSFHKNLSEDTKDESDVFIFYSQKIQKIKNEDEKLCVTLDKFWTEIISKSPKIEKINELMSHLSNSLEKMNAGYSLLMSKFPKSLEILSLYSSFLLNILLDSEKSLVLTNKRYSMQKPNYSKTLNFFDEENGTIIISCDINSFGEIKFTNRKILEHLEYDESIQGSLFFEYIPQPYGKYIQNHFFRYVHSVKDPNLQLPNNVFLISKNGFLKEFKIRACIAAHKNELSLVVTLKKRLDTHKVALILDSESIVSISESFLALLDISKTDLIGVNYKTLFPDLKNLDILHNVGYNIIIKNKNYGLILCSVEFETHKIVYLMISDDPKELLSWKNHTNEKNLNINRLKTLDMDSNIEENKEHEIGHKRVLLSQKSINFKPELKSKETAISDISQLDNDNKSSKELYSAVSTLTNKSLLISQKSARSINIFNWILITSVIFKQILVVITTNIAVLIYTQKQIDTASEITIPSSLGKLNRIFVDLAYRSRTLRLLVSIYSEQSILEMLPRYQTSLDGLDELNTVILDNIKSWTICEAQNLYATNSFPL